MRSLFLALACSLLVAFTLSGCGFKRPPANTFPGSDSYSARVESFKITPQQAYQIAYEEAQTDRQLHYVSKKPTVIAKRWYVFSVPQASGATLQGYHVNGDNGEVKFVNEKKTVQNLGR